MTALLARQAATISGDGQQSRDFAYVANVVHGNLLVAHNAAGRVFNAANSRATRLQSLTRN
jgi:nucleoside-diphosphate-sugar epimerase